MSDLTEFLLARIAEDERVVPTPDLERKSTSRAWYSTDFDVVFVDEDRWLADCVAKRGVVAVCMLMEGRPENILGSYAYEILCRLAAVYADHPDYRAEWQI